MILPLSQLKTESNASNSRQQTPCQRGGSMREGNDKGNSLDSGGSRQILFLLTHMHTRKHTHTHTYANLLNQDTALLLNLSPLTTTILLLLYRTKKESSKVHSMKSQKQKKSERGPGWNQCKTPKNKKTQGTCFCSWAKYKQQQCAVMMLARSSAKSAPR